VRSFNDWICDGEGCAARVPLTSDGKPSWMGEQPVLPPGWTRITIAAEGLAMWHFGARELCPRCSVMQRGAL
jgi:hypothetical protein